jgi:Ca-activated chloride channel family protein
MKKVILPALVLFISCFCVQFCVQAQEKTSVAIEDVKETKPISLGVVVDNSGSFRMVLEYVIDTTKVITRNIQTSDEAFLVRFISKDRIETLQEFTGDRTLLALAAEEMFCEGGLTAIPEAVFYSAKKLVDEGKNEQKILVLITDGESTSDKKVYADILTFLKEKKIRVYIVGITMLLDKNIGESKKFLEKLAAETGGSVIFIDRKISAAEAGNSITKAIHGQ